MVEEIVSSIFNSIRRINMSIMAIIPSEELKRKLQEYAESLNEGEKYTFIIIEDIVKKKDIMFPTLDKANKNNLFELMEEKAIFQSYYPLLKINAYGVNDFIVIKDLFVQIYKEFNFDFYEYLINPPEELS